MIYKLKELGVNQVSIAYIRLLIFNLTELKTLRNTKWQLRDCDMDCKLCIYVLRVCNYVYATVFFIQIFYKVHFPMKFPREFTLEFVYTGL